VIVPTYNRPDSLDRCLASLALQDIGRDRFEVVVVNDGGVASPSAIVDRHRGALDVRLIEQANAGPAAARNAGAAVARGEYLVFTDDDCLPVPTWLSTMAGSTARHPGLAVGGRVENAASDVIYSSASQELIDFLYGFYNEPGAQDSTSASRSPPPRTAIWWTAGASRVARSSTTIAPSCATPTRSGFAPSSAST
jgi:glycosyltransferase involved in cell wall biosynthesis